MTLKPTLQLRALRVRRGRGVAYAADFHAGVNIVRGQNASGKSSVMDFIFYALGGEDIPWKNEALLCDEVVAEILLNDAPVCLKRAVNESVRNPMLIYWGELSKAEVAPFDEWQTYPYQRSGSKESFSQVLFRALELPELRGEGAANITMHQLLRLMYVDQRTPNDEIFRHEAFEAELNRETIGNYLCGIYSGELYEAQLELKKVDASLDRAVSDLKNLFLVLGKSGQAGGTTSDFLRAEAASLQDEILTLEEKLRTFRQGRGVAVEGSSNQLLVEIRSQLNRVQARLAEAQTRVTELQLEIQDSKLFIAELDRRISALADSSVARTYLGNLKFNFCPCCLNQVAVEDDKSNNCHLCKNSLSEKPADAQILRMKNELSLQRKESGALLKVRMEETSRLDSELPELKSSLKKLEQRYFSASSSWSTPAELAVEDTARKLGELSQKLEQIAQYQKLANVIEDLQAKRADLEAQKRSLSDLISSLLYQNEDLKKAAKLSIASELVGLLRADLPRQDEFISAAAAAWSFAKNRVAINGNTQFSESSMVILRHSFHLALLLASVKNAFFRFPRFLLLDGIEDGGQEQARSFRFQRLIVEACSELPNNFQVIYATSQIEPTLEDKDFVVGKASTRDDKTLAIS